MLRLTLPFPRMLGSEDVICGAGALMTLAGLRATRIAIVASERMQQTPSMPRLVKALGKSSVKLFSPSWVDEPTWSDIPPLAQRITEFCPDWMIAIGGGSVLDGAKLCWALYEHPNLSPDRLALPFSLPPLRKRAKFVAVPTTSGTGSEASSSAVFSDVETGVKVAVVSHDFLPDIAILDPELSVDLPLPITLTSGLDAISHAIEGYVSTQANALVRPLAGIAVEHMLKALDVLVDRPADLDARTEALVAAYYAGIVQNMCVVGPAHAIAHNLGAVGIPHGLATGILLPRVMQFLQSNDDVKSAYDALARTAGLKNAEGLVEKITELPTTYGLSPKLGDVASGISQKDAPEYFEKVGSAAIEDRLARFFPTPVMARDAGAILESVW